MMTTRHMQRASISEDFGWVCRRHLLAGVSLACAVRG